MAIVLDGTSGITTPDLTDTSLTSGRVVYAGASGNLTGSTALTFDGTNLALTQSGNPTMTVKTTGAGNNPLYRLQADTNYWEILGVFSDANDTLRIRYNGADKMILNRDGTMALAGGDSDATGVGITFPPTQVASSNANTLDDYEEGTFTSSMTPLTSGTITLSASTCSYVKIGRSVTVNGQLNTSAVSTPTGRLRVGGFPFTVASGTQFESRAIVNVIGGVAIIAIDSWIPSGGNFIDIYPTGTTTDTYASNIDGSTSLYFSATYQTT